MEIEVISCFLILLQKRKNLPIGADLSLNHIGTVGHISFFKIEPHTGFRVQSVVLPRIAPAAYPGLSTFCSCGTGTNK